MIIEQSVFPRARKPCHGTYYLFRGADVIRALSRAIGGRYRLEQEMARLSAGGIP